MAPKGQNGQYTSPCRFVYYVVKNKTLKAYLLDLVSVLRFSRAWKGLSVKKFLDFILSKSSQEQSETSKQTNIVLR